MRTFHSYGPINAKKHYYVPRNKLIDKCIKSLIGDLDDLGRYFTIWGPRQTGKTWLYRQSLAHIKHHYSDQFIVGEFSMQGIVFKGNNDNEQIFFNNMPDMFDNSFSIQTGKIQSWIDWKRIFSKKNTSFDRPLILVIDEFDKLPTKIIDNLISIFREMYLNRNSYILHGLALVGVRAVLGIESKSGSPFNIQRSLHIENLSFNEVKSMFDQYQAESSQHVESDIIEKIYLKTQGQPGLIGWFGELLTEKYNLAPEKAIDMKMWNRVYIKACEIEHNNTVQNIIAKARNEYKSYVIKLFTNASVHFSFYYDWCNYMYMNGLIGYEYVEEKENQYHICRFSSPFIQTCLYSALVEEIKENHVNTSNNLIKMQKNI